MVSFPKSSILLVVVQTVQFDYITRSQNQARGFKDAIFLSKTTLASVFIFSL